MIIRRLLLFLFFLFVLIASLLFYLGSSSGSRLVWDLINEHYPDQISAGKFAGKFSESVQLSDVKIQLEGLVIDAQHFEFGWQPLALLQGKVLIKQLRLEGVEIDDQRPPSEDKTSPPLQLEDIELPLAISIEQVHLEQIHYQSKTQAALTLDLLTLALHGEHSQLSIKQLFIKAMGAELDLQGQITSRDDYPLELQINWQADLAHTGNTANTGNMANTAATTPLKLAGSASIDGSLDELNISHQLQAPANMQLEAQLINPLDQLRWTAALKLDHLLLQNLKSDLPEIGLAATLHGEGDLQNLQLDADYAIDSEQFKNWKGQIRINRRAEDDKNILLDRFTIKANDEDAQFDLKGSIRLDDIVKLDLKGGWQAIRWPLNDKALITSPQGKVDLSGHADDYQLQINTQVHHAQVGDIDLDLKGHGDSQQFVLQQLHSDLLSGSLITRGQVSWAKADLSFDLSGDWQDLIWQQNDQRIELDKGELALTGDLEDYQLTLKSKLGGSALPAGLWMIRGQGDQQSFDLASLHGDTLGGTLDLVGQLGWGEKTHWQLELKGDDLNPAGLQADWPGKLTISSQLSGQLQGDQLQAKLHQTQISGRLRDYPFQLASSLDLLDQIIQIKQLDLSSGQSNLSVSGQAGELLDLKLDLNSSNLAELYPDARGSLKAQGRVKGALEKPQVNATVTATQLRLAELELGQLNSTIKLDLAELEKTNAFDIKLDSKQIKLGKNLINSLLISADGSLAAHSLRGNLKSTQGNVTLLTSGQLKNQQWAGVIKQLTLSEPDLGDWILAKATPLSASAEKAALDDLCLAQKNARLCLQGGWQKNGNWQASSRIEQLPFALFKAYLADNIQLQGSLSSNFKAQGDGKKKITGELVVDLPAGNIQIDSDEKSSTIKYDRSSLNLALDHQGAKADLLLQLLEPTQNPVRFNLTTPPLDLATMDIMQLPLKGQLTTQIDDLSFVQQFTDQLEKLHGKLDVDMSIAGTLSKPSIQGHTHLQSGFFVHDLGIQLDDVNFKIDSLDGQHLNIAGQAKSAQGLLNIDGNIDLIKEGFPTHITVKAKRFEMINLPEAWLLASPDLSIDYANNQLSIAGEILIPEAKLEPQGIASSVPISSDVTIINDPEPQPEKTSPLKLNTQVKIILGDKISLSSLGFGGNLTGSLLITGEPEMPMLGSGEIIVKNGLFEAYGQKLDIDKGRVIFTGGPVDSPNIDLKASRKIKTISAGVHATGPVAQPELTLFSSPQMNEDDILSYMMIGRPLREASQDEGQLLSRAATSLGFKGANALTSKIGQSLGLDELSIDGGKNGGKDATLKIGKYLTPKLYIGYGVGLFETVTKMNIRYDLSKRWTMEAESGTNSAMDMLYKYER